jgi:uncharacterized protein (DUF2164 family)
VSSVSPVVASLSVISRYSLNQGVRDASSFMQEKLADIEGDIYERDDGR